ncbi:sulfotransferase family protein [Streptomyces sp. NPDC054796]
MLRIIGAGLPRTGTKSTQTALELLGLGPCHHMSEVLTHPEQVDRWLSAGSDGPVDWDHVLEGYVSAVDWPSGLFWRELAQAYPEAKVILTVRDPHRWYTSFRTLAERSDSMREAVEQAPAEMRPLLEGMQRLRPLLDSKGKEIFGPDWQMGQDMSDEDAIVAAYHRHIAAVREEIDPERLLVFDVREGWGPLCAFLGVEPPAGEEFPRLNDTASMGRMFEQMMTEGRVVFPSASAPGTGGQAAD